LTFDAAEWFGVRIPHRLVFVAESLRAAFGGRGVVIPVGVPFAKLRVALDHRDQVRSELRLGDAVTLAFVGRVTADKGIWTLIESFRSARWATNVPLKLLVIGPFDAVREEIVRRTEDAREEIRIMGPREEPWRYVAASDVFVLPSFREGLPLSLLEAMALGIPPITSSVGDMPLILQARVTGWLVPPGDAKALSRVIVQVTRDKDLRVLVGKRASELVKARYDEAVTLDAYRRIYSELMVHPSMSPPIP